MMINLVIYLVILIVIYGCVFFCMVLRLTMGEVIDSRGVSHEHSKLLCYKLVR